MNGCYMERSFTKTLNKWLPKDDRKLWKKKEKEEKLLMDLQDVNTCTRACRKENITDHVEDENAARLDSQKRQMTYYNQYSQVVVQAYATKPKTKLCLSDREV